jgi:hypothetical protein
VGQPFLRPAFRVLWLSPLGGGPRNQVLRQISTLFCRSWSLLPGCVPVAPFRLSGHVGDHGPEVAGPVRSSPDTPAGIE